MRKCAGLLVLAALVLLAPSPTRAETIFGLTTGNSLVIFDSASPGNVSVPIPITGLVGGVGESVVGIDFRPVDGALVALTRQQTGANVGRGRIYEINTVTGAATLINPMLTNAVGGLEVLLSAPGAFDYGIDFNPVPNALRIVNNSDQTCGSSAGGPV